MDPVPQLPPGYPARLPVSAYGLGALCGGGPQNPVMAEEAEEVLDLAPIGGVKDEGGGGAVRLRAFGRGW